MPDPESPKSPDGNTAFDRMMRFGTALFAVKKDELPKRDDKKAPRKKRATKPEPG